MIGVPRSQQQRRRLFAFGLAAQVLLVCACAGVHPAGTRNPYPSPAARGYRALFRGESEGPKGKGRFRLAVAILPPDRARLEFFGPSGGPWLVVTATPDTTLALLPAQRVYEQAGPSAKAIERFLGVPLEARGLIALLTGRPMCTEESMRVEVMTRPAATFGRTLSWYEVSCPPADVRYQARCEDRGGTLLSATVSEGISGAIILEADYGGYDKGLGPRWPRQVRLRLSGKATLIQLSAVEGPWASDVPEAIFTPEIPEGFESTTLSLFPAGPGLPGAESHPAN
ncbi:MAG: hypothetical protein AUI52_01525 [Acidobacteria bacterium 13_1_40CM_2_68_10]|nr:MAG: hypothetical protein AUI52_01525 [Acidobacteria bacterium 13_1_40CM_2_68_10]